MLIDIVTIQHLITSVCHAEHLPHFGVAAHHYKTDSGILTETDLALQFHLSSLLP